jgi:hypothetical protein
MRVALSAGVFVAVAVLAVAAPVPKPGAAKLPPPTEKQLEQSKNNLKQIMIAVHSYCDVTGAVPNNVFDAKAKKTLLSWRVHLLPYLGEEQLYKQFKLDEAWDGETNMKLVEKMPKVFAPIRVKAKPGETFYRGFTGADTVFEAGARYGIAQIPDGTSNTIGVVEAGEPCVWTKPDDLPFDPTKPLPKLGGMFEDTFHVALMDGSVQAVNGKKMDADAFKRMLVRSSGLVRDTKAAFGE